MVDFNGDGVDKIKWELNEKDYTLISIATVATHGLLFYESGQVTKSLLLWEKVAAAG